MKTKYSFTALAFLSIVMFGMFLTMGLTAQGWYDQNWQFRRPVTIVNPGGTGLTNYQVMITLSSSSFDFSKANSDGSDVRATDSDGTTLIPFWIEEWNNVSQLAKVWIKIPSIPSGGTTAYIYYGYSAAAATSNGTSTFNLFDDEWISSTGNLNPVHVATQPWWEATVSYPIVFEDNSFPERPRFHMLYDGHAMIGHAKGYATSSNLSTWTSYDNGLSGNARINPIMGPGYSGGTQFAWGDFIKVGPAFHMYPSSGPGTTVHCQSTDLIHWTDQYGGTATYDALTTNDPSGIGTGVAILKEADGKTPVIVDGKYWMIYFHGGSGGNMYMAYADIGNLLNWTTCYSGSPVLTPSGWEGGGLWTPSFVKVNDKYYIYYQAGSPYRIGFASAPSISSGNPVRPDQTTWTKSPNNPVITNTHGWDNGFCQDPVLRCFDGVYYLFYTGDPPWTNGFATSSSPEGPWVQYGQSGGGGVNWTKTGTPTVTSGIINFTTGQAIQSPAPYSPGTAVGFRANYGPQGGAENRWGGFITGTGGTSPPDRAIIQKQVTPYAPDNNHAYLSTHPTYTELSLLDNQFHVYEVLWRSGRADAILDHGAGSVFSTTNVPSASLPVTFYNYAGTSPLQVDWVFVRQYSNPEPTSAIGTEQPLCPNPPGVNNPVIYCVGTTAVPLTAAGSNLLWYTTSSGGTGSSAAPTPSTATVGTTSYWVSQTVNSCESDRAQIDVIVNETPIAPTADVTQPTCEVPTGIITVTSSITGLSFSIDGVNYTNTTGIFTGVNPGNYNLTAKNSYECISVATSIVINTVPGAPPAPTVNITQPTCTVVTGTITITAPTGTGMTYSIDGINYANTTGVFTEVSPGNYSVTAKDISGCFSPVTNVTVNPAPPTPQAPTANVSHPTCIIITGTITVTSSLTGLSFSIDGADYSNTTGIFTGVVPGEYPLTAKNSSNCISSATMVTVNPAPPLPAGTIAAVDPDLCYGELYYQIKLATATGQAPFSLVVDGVTYNNVNVGQTFANLSTINSAWNNSNPGIGGPAGNSPYELGVKFRSTITGYIRGIRYYKASSNTGVHYGRLWSISGTKLAEATFTGESASGWQEVLFSTPVAITANTVYVASYNVNGSGQFHYNPNYFTTGYTNGNLYLLSNTDPPAGNGVYTTNPGTFPATGTGSNYWVDVVFSTWNNIPATLTSNMTSITDAGGCNNTGNPLSSATVTINVTPNGTISSAGTVCEGTDMSLIFNATVGNSPFSLVVNGNIYNGISSGVPFNVGTTGTSQPQSIWPSTSGTDNGANTTALELGVKFRSSVSGQITGIRFYKVGTNTTGYSGTLWTSTGTQLATANFPALTTTGWHQVNFTTPVTIQPNMTYVASYHVPTGNFAANVDYFASSGVTNGALTALQNGTDGPNGVYAASSSITFPNQTHNSTNYWVDVVFLPNGKNFELTSITSAAGCVKTGSPLSNAVIQEYTNSSAPGSISGISSIEAGTSTTLSVVGGSLGYNASWKWYSGTCGGTLEGTGTSVTVSPIETTDYFVRAEGLCNTTSCAQLTVTVTHPLTTWTGASSTDWSVAGNWSNGVPIVYKNAIIPAVSNQPHITALPVSPAQCRDLTIESGAVVTIDADKALTVNGVLTNNTGNTGLVILSDAAATGSLIENSGVNSTIKRFLTDDRWHYISPPVDNSLAGVFMGIYMMKWNEPTGLWSYITDPNFVMATDMEAYAIWAINPSTVTFTGVANSGPRSFNVTNTFGASHQNKGYNFAGNPYPSSVDWNVNDGSGWTRTAGNIDLAVYIWNGSQYGAYVKGQPLGTNGVDNIIPPHQGFYVHCSAASGYIAVDNRARIHASKDIYKSSDFTAPLIKLKAEGNSGSDEIILSLIPEATVYYDGQFDAMKMRGDQSLPQLYSVSKDEMELSINAFPETEDYKLIPLGFEAGIEALYTISVSELTGFESFAGIYLEDLKDNTFNKMEANSHYSFTASPLDDAIRFLLHLSGELDVQENLNQESNIMVYSFDQQVYITSESRMNGNVRIYDLLGKKIVNEKLNGETIKKIDLSGHDGYMIVNVLTENGSLNKKVFVK